MVSELLFNINNLISPKMQERLDNCFTINEKAETLFRLTEFTSYFSAEEVDEIQAHWLQKTGEPYEAVYLTEDDKEFIREFLQYFPDLEKVKNLINGICTSATYDDCIAKAQFEIEKKKTEQLREAFDKSKTIHTHLRFDDDISEDKPRKLSLEERLASARIKAAALNSQK